ncbi:MAG: hypothetical protein NTW76_13715 [Corynebacteriales bacterium]|nr:hypothetical protein [Mycobacteriales bacterium]
MKLPGVSSSGRVRAAVVAVVAIVAVAPSAGQAAGAPASRSETTWSSTSPVAGVISSVVRIAAPLPPSAGPHPAKCDTLSYLRWRSATGPSDHRKADRILVAQPGVFEGAGAFDSVARNTVAAAAAQGSSIEFWALDRRSNCLDDHTGITAAISARDYRVASDYYLRGREVDGRRFAGYADGADTAWLKNVGIEQTLRDQYTVLREAFPDPRQRRAKVLCGGHSLGGFLTGYFAEWDFDGNRRTTDDAGYRQCGGWFALDTAIKAGAPNPTSVQLPDVPPPLAALGEPIFSAVDTALPVLRLPAVINPETVNLLSLAATAAQVDPDGVNSVVDSLPVSINITLTLRALLSKDAAMAATGSPDIRALRATNTAVLGSLLDDNSQPLGFLQASVGFPTGSPVGPKSFPVPDTLRRLPLVDGQFGDARKAAPTFYDAAHLYRWLDYDEVGGTRSLPNESQFTTRAGEVTSIRELARSFVEPPLDFTEAYFPSRIALDLAQSTAPSIARHLLYRNGIGANPTLTIKASGGVALSGQRGAGRFVIAPGYNHLDVLTAAQTQNNGRPEIVSSELTRFAIDPGSARR